MGKKQRKTKNKPSKCNSELHHPLTSMAEPPAARASTQHPGLSRHQGFHRTPEALTSQHPGAGSRGSRDYHPRDVMSRANMAARSVAYLCIYSCFMRTHVLSTRLLFLLHQ